MSESETESEEVEIDYQKILRLHQAAKDSNISLVTYSITDADYDTLLEMIRQYSFEELPFSEEFRTKHEKLIRTTLRDAFFEKGGDMDSVPLELVEFLTADDFESTDEDEELEEEQEEETEEVDENYMLEYDIAGLHFEVERDYEDITVKCQLPGSGQNVVVAELDVDPPIVSLVDFMWSRREETKEFYLAAKKLAKAERRTFAGIVMEVIKKSLKSDEALEVRVDDNGWITNQGTEQEIDTGDVQATAGKMLDQELKLEPRPGESEEYVKNYLRKRYKQLHPSGEVPFDSYLEGLKENGWYGAWIPNQWAVDKDDLIVTKARPTKFVDHMNIYSACLP